ncbi:MAG: YkgJ family cysteine cluster protein [Planctomycetota bacterium]|nr:YkgJ family cysteine cluster protein [Planctomycetota bacterium]
MTQWWRKEGLPFQCTQCGNCCRVEGYVWVEQEDIDKLAKLLEITPAAFEKQFVRQVGHKRSLIEKPNFECIFWEDGCSVYPARPPQCKSYPFWSENLESLEAWLDVVEECPGSGTGPVYSSEEIAELLGGRGETGKKES